MPPNTTKQSRRKTSIIIGAASILIVLVIYLLKDNIANELKLFLRILFAIGCGGLSAALIGFITISYNANSQISAGGGLAVFVLIYFFPPFGFGQTDFSSSIYLKNAITNNPIESSEISLDIRLDENSKAGEFIPTSNVFLFKPLPINYLDKEVEVMLINNSKWVFENKKTTTKITLSVGSIDVKILRDSLSLLIKGNITDSLLNPLKDVTVMVVDDVSLSKPTDAYGSFVLQFPPTYNLDNAKLRIMLKGFRTREDNFKLGESNSITLYHQ
jgi:hypothetical protein